MSFNGGGEEILPGRHEAGYLGWLGLRLCVPQGTYAQHCETVAQSDPIHRHPGVAYGSNCLPYSPFPSP